MMAVEAERVMNRLLVALLIVVVLIGTFVLWHVATENRAQSHVPMDGRTQPKCVG